MMTKQIRKEILSEVDGVELPKAFISGNSISVGF
jgi:hypothetical protein